MIRTFIQITSLLLTLQAAVFLAKGNLGLSAQAITSLSSTKWGHNADLVANLAQQRADTWVGVILLLAAFLLQMWNALWPMRWVDFGVHRGAAAYALVFSLLVAFGAYFASREAAQQTAAGVTKLLNSTPPSSKGSSADSG